MWEKKLDASESAGIHNWTYVMLLKNIFLDENRFILIFILTLFIVTWRQKKARFIRSKPDWRQEYQTTGEESKVQEKEENQRSDYSGAI